MSVLNPFLASNSKSSDVASLATPGSVGVSIVPRSEGPQMPAPISDSDPSACAEQSSSKTVASSYTDPMLGVVPILRCSLSHAQVNENRTWIGADWNVWEWSGAPQNATFSSNLHSDPEIPMISDFFPNLSTSTTCCLEVVHSGCILL